MKKLLIGIGSLGVAFGVYAQGYMNGATFIGAADSPALLANYYQGASFSYTYKGSNYVYENMIGFAPGPANPNLGANSDKIPDLNLGPNPGAAKYQVALYIGAKGETDMARFFRALPAAGNPTNATFAAAKAGYVLSSGIAGRSTKGLINGQEVTFQPGDEISAQVRAWVSSPGTPEYASYEEFMQNVGFGAGGQAGYAGASGIAQTKSGTQTIPGTFSPTGGTPLTGVWFLYPVPEPSVVGLGLLGLAGLFFIRRRK
jgi:MYXO-CTERM domain-containing protein